MSEVKEQQDSAERHDAIVEAVMKAVQDESPVTGPARCVEICLAYHVDPEWVERQGCALASPSIGAIAKWCGWSQRAVEISLRNLEDAERIKRTGALKERGVVEYRLLLEQYVTQCDRTFPYGRTLYYEGDDPERFRAEIKEEFGLDVAADYDRYIPGSDQPLPRIPWGEWCEASGGDRFQMFTFKCPPEYVDAIYGTGLRWPVGT